MKCFIKSILAGLAISLGGWLYLCVNNKMDNNILAAFLFSFGLILICNFGFNLYNSAIYTVQLIAPCPIGVSAKALPNYLRIKDEKRV